MKRSHWPSALPLLATVLIPNPSYGASCAVSRLGSAFIGIEFTATAGPNSAGEYRYQSINLYCNSEGEVTWNNWPYLIDLGWHYPENIVDTLPPTGFRSNHRVFINTCGTRLVGVNERFSGQVSGINLALADHPLQNDSYQDRFEQPLYITSAEQVAKCSLAKPPTDEFLGSNSHCSQPMVANNINAVSGNNFYRESDIDLAELRFERVYNSRSDNSGTLGPDWQHNFEQALSVREDHITALRPDGRVMVFTTISDNTWRSAQDPSAIVRRQQTHAGGYTYSDRSGIVHTFNNDGRWQTTIDQNGRVLSGVYANTRLARIEDQYGNALELAYTHSGKLASVIDPQQRLSSYTYHDSGLLASTTRPDGSTRHYHYGADSQQPQLTGISNTRAEPLAAWRYDNQQRVVALFHGEDSGLLSNNANNYSLDYLPSSTRVTNPLGKQTIYHFTEQNSGQRVSKVEGLSTDNCFSDQREYIYHPSGLVQSKINSNGNHTELAYNERGLQTLRLDAAGHSEQRTTLSQWHPTLNKPLLIDEGIRQTTLTYDSVGRLLSKTISDNSAWQSESQQWLYRYNDSGRLTQVDGPRTDVDDRWQFDYDAAGHLSRLTNPLGHSITVSTSDSSGLPTRIIDENGVERLLSYDSLGRLTTAETAGLVSRYAYNESDQLTRIELPGAGAIEYAYDSAGRLIAITNGAGQRINYTLDPAGNRLSQTIVDQYGEVVFASGKQFDELNRLLKELDASGQRGLTYTYDAEGNRTDDIEPLGARTTRLYDALNRLTQVTQRDMGVISYTYDGLDQLATITDPQGLVTDYDYDGLGNLVRLNSPDSGVTQYAYDAAGNVIQRIDARGITANYRYDALNRLVSVAYPSAPSLNADYHYDNRTDQNYGVGRLTRIDDASGNTAIIYDSLGQIIGRQIELGEHSYQWSYTHHPTGQLASITSPDGNIVSYRHSESGLLSSVSLRAHQDEDEQILLDQIEWHPFGSIKSWRSGNQVTTRFTMDKNYRLSELDATGHEAVMARHYGYNALQDIVNIENAVVDQASQQLAYDPQHRLESASGSYGHISYSYDEVGNRLTRELDNGSTQDIARYAYSPASNRLASIGINEQGRQKLIALTYDANGNVVALDDRHFSYNDANRMSHFSRAGNSQSMTYNALGQRVSVTQGNEVQHFHYDLQGRLTAQSDANTGQFTREYVYAAGQIIAIVDQTTDIDIDIDIDIDTANNEGFNQRVPKLLQSLKTVSHYQAIAAWLVERFISVNPTQPHRTLPSFLLESSKRSQCQRQQCLLTKPMRRLAKNKHRR